MTSPTGSTRVLPFPLKFNEDIESQTPDEDIAILDVSDFPIDSDERINIVLDISLNEYVALANAIDVGRDISYGDNSIYIWWIWVRSLISMDICQSIVDCINDPESGVMDAINSLLADNAYPSGYEASQAQGDYELGSGNNPECDPDAWWAGCLGLVQRLNRINEDVLEEFEVITNQTELIADIIGSIGGIDLTGVPALFTWVTTMQNDIIENYLAEYTVAYEESVACDLFCMALVDCKLTPTMIFNYFRDRLSGSITFDGLFWETLDFLTSGTWSGTQICDFLMMSQIGLRAGIGVFFGQTAWNDIDLAITLGFNDANDDWVALCDDCPDVIHRLGGDGNDDMAVLQWGGAPPYDTPIGTYDSESDSYIAGQSIANNYALLNVTFTFAEEVNISKIILSSSIVVSRDEAGSNFQILLDDIPIYTDALETNSSPHAYGVNEDFAETGTVLSFRWACGGSTISPANAQFSPLTIEYSIT